jgi:hypothetical protein
MPSNNAMMNMDSSKVKPAPENALLLSVEFFVRWPQQAHVGACLGCLVNKESPNYCFSSGDQVLRFDGGCAAQARMRPPLARIVCQAQRIVVRQLGQPGVYLLPNANQGRCSTIWEFVVRLRNFRYPRLWVCRKVQPIATQLSIQIRLAMQPLNSVKPTVDCALPKISSGGQVRRQTMGFHRQSVLLGPAAGDSDQSFAFA